MSNPNYDNRYADLETVDEAILFYAEKMAFGCSSFQIRRMLRVHFPELNVKTCNRIRKGALKYLKELAAAIEKSDYVAESILRLKRIMSNPSEKTKNILNADASLTALLRLAEADTQSPEDKAAELADLIIQFKEQAAQTVGGKTKDENTSSEKTPTQDGKQNENATQTEQEGQDEITAKDEQELKVARLKRLKVKLAEEQNK